MVSLPPFSLVECQDGSLIAGTARGLARFQGGVWKDATREWNFPGKQARKANAGQAGVSMVFVDRAGTLWVVDAQPVMTAEELIERVRYAAPPTPDDVTILWDGRRLDSREAVMEWLAEVEAKRAEEAVASAHAEP